MAQAPAPQYYRKAYQDLSGGLCTRINPLNVPANKFVQLDNAVLAEHDILEKAPGFVIDGAPFPNVSGSFIRMLSSYRVGDSVNSLVVAAADAGNANATYKVDLKQTFGDGTYNYIGYTDGTATFTNGSAVVTGLSTLWSTVLKAGDKIHYGSLGWQEILSVDSDTQVTLTGNWSSASSSGSVAYMARIILSVSGIPVSAVINNKLVMTNGIDSMFEFDNSTMSMIPTAPRGSLLEFHKNRMFTAAPSSNPSLLAWSKSSDETTWDAASETPVFEADNGNIVAIKSFANSLIVFKDNGKIYQVVGEFDQDVVGAPAMMRRIDIQDNIGVIAGKTVVVNDDNKIYFLSETGYWTLDSRGFVEKISWDINPTLANLIFKTASSAAKQFSYISKAQWDTGTLTAVNDTRFSNAIAPYFDNTTITGNYAATGAMATATAPNGDVHVAWITSDQTKVMHTLYRASDNVALTPSIALTPASFIINPPETYLNPPVKALRVSIAVAPNGNVGIVSTNLDASNNLYFVYSEFASGTWTSKTIYDHYNVWAGYSGTYYGYLIGQIGYGIAGAASDIHFTAGSDPQILICMGSGGSGAVGTGGMSYITRSSGVFSTTYLDTIIGSYFPWIYRDCKFTVDGSGNVYVACVSARTETPTPTHNWDVVEYFYSNDGGATFTTPLTSSSLGVSYLTPAGTYPAENANQYISGGLGIGLNNDGEVIIVYNFTYSSGGDESKIVRYNVTPHTPVKTVMFSSALTWSASFNIDSNGAEMYSYLPKVTNYETISYEVVYNKGTATFNGTSTVVGTGTKWSQWVSAGDVIKLGSDSETDFATVQTVNSDTSITLTGSYAGTSASGAYISKRMLSAANTTSSGIPYACGVSNLQSGVLSTIFFDDSSNLLCRRITPNGLYATGVVSDASLSAWGTFATSGVTTGGNIVIFEVGTSATSSISVAQTSTITNGSTIPGSAANVYADAFITFHLAAYAQASVKSMILNYTGSGTDADLMTAFVFNNDMYTSVTENGNTGNNKVIFFDRKHAWIDRTFGVTCFAKMSQVGALQYLYAGSSTGGNVYKLNTVYNMGGGSYDMVAVTKEDLLGSLELQKDVYKAYVVFEVKSAGTFTFSYRLDNYTSVAGSAWKDFTIDQTKKGIAEIPIGATCSSIQFKIENDNLDEQVGFVGFTLLYSYLNLR